MLQLLTPENPLLPLHTKSKRFLWIQNSICLSLNSLYKPNLTQLGYHHKYVIVAINENWIHHSNLESRMAYWKQRQRISKCALVDTLSAIILLWRNHEELPERWQKCIDFIGVRYFILWFTNLRNESTVLQHQFRLCLNHEAYVDTVE